MASIKLKHASGNSTILNSPAANPTNDVTLKLPSTTGSAGQVLKVASANHSATNAELEFGADTGGKLLQIVETKITDVKSLAATTSWQDMPGFSVTITPSAANSKILVKAMINHSNRINHTGGRFVRSVGGSVAIPTGWVGDASSNRTQSSIGNIFELWYPGEDSNAALPFEMIDDSHNTTAAITYKLQFYCYQSGSYYVYLNRPWGDTDAAYTYRAVSSIIAMEIAA